MNKKTLFHAVQAKRKLLAAILSLGFIVSSASAQEPADEDDPVVPKEPRQIANPLFDDAKLQANVFYFQRDRDRYNVELGEYRTNLHHSTIQTNIEFSSGFWAKSIGFDLAVFGTTDLENSGSPDHEFSFFPWDNPWSPNWMQADARSGFSLYRAHLKLKHEEQWAKLGYFQPSGPGVLGVNWSFMPGTYLGTELGGSYGQLNYAAAYVTRYKAPWYQDTYGFRQNDGTTPVDYLWSLGAQYALTPQLSAELAYGESQNYLKNAHLKLRYQPDTSWGLAYHFYWMDDSNDGDSVNNNFAGAAYEHYLAAYYNPLPWSFKAEFLNTYAPNDRPENVGYFAYRMISAYGGAKGAYDVWWDNRSDWDHHKESAVFIKLSRSLDDIIGYPGWVAGASAARGWGGKMFGVSQTLNESAYSLDLGYTVPSGKLKNVSFNLHYTHYNNKTDLPSWTGFKNAFQDERDIKFFIVIPCFP